MQLNDILEENSVKAISDKTQIPEENLEYLLASEFDALTRVKTLGFISILEREYQADLGAVREKALEHYGHSRPEHLFPIGQPVMDEHRSKPKGLIILILILLGVSSWYFFTQFDKKHLNELIPFMAEQTIEEESVAADLNIENTLKTREETIDKDVVTPVSESLEKQKESESDAVQKEENSTQNVTISLLPVNSVDKMKKV